MSGNLPLTINQHDGDKLIRKRNDLQNVIRENLESLTARNLIDWLEPLDLFHEHVSGKSAHGEMLLRLYWFEIRLKAEVIVVEGVDTPSR